MNRRSIDVILSRQPRLLEFYYFSCCRRRRVAAPVFHISAPCLSVFVMLRMMQSLAVQNFKTGANVVCAFFVLFLVSQEMAFDLRRVMLCLWKFD